MFKEYPQYDATGLAGLIAGGEITAAEVLEACLARIAAGEPRLNAMVEILAARARVQAAVPFSGPFAGVPFLLKDLQQELAGVRTTLGTAALRNHIAPETSEITKRFMAAGLIIAGTTATPELGLKPSTETALHGATRNPWDLSRTPGGSSGGSAAAVAARYVPMAGASDGGGSIRIPAAYCGLFGLKPSRGRIPTGPLYGESWEGAVAAGVLSRSVRDTAALLDAISGPDSGAPFEIAPPERKYLEEVGAPVEKLRIGFSHRSPIGGRVEPAQIEAVQAAALLLESLGHEVEEAEPALDGMEVFRCFMAMYYGHVAAQVDEIRRRTGAPETLFEMDTRVTALLGRTFTAGAFVARRNQWNDFGRAMGKFHQRHDIHMTPVTAMGPARIGEMDTPAREAAASKWIVRLRAGNFLIRTGMVEKIALQQMERTPFTQLANMSFCPAMSVPLHRGEDGLPVGVQFAAKFGAEGVLLRLAAQLEQAQPWGHLAPADWR